MWQFGSEDDDGGKVLESSETFGNEEIGGVLLCDNTPSTPGNSTSEEAPTFYFPLDYIPTHNWNKLPQSFGSCQHFSNLKQA